MALGLSGLECRVTSWRKAEGQVMWQDVLSRTVCCRRASQQWSLTSEVLCGLRAPEEPLGFTREGFSVEGLGV